MTNVKSNNGKSQIPYHYRKTDRDGPVYHKPLHQHSRERPMTGVKRDGYCEVPKDDNGNHSVAGVCLAGRAV